MAQWYHGTMVPCHHGTKAEGYRVLEELLAAAPVQDSYNMQSINEPCELASISWVTADRMAQSGRGGLMAWQSVIVDG